jgi:hypothetical protein
LRVNRGSGVVGGPGHRWMDDADVFLTVTGCENVEEIK